jgi:hypothetical protein
VDRLVSAPPIWPEVFRYKTFMSKRSPTKKKIQFVSRDSMNIAPVANIAEKGTHRERDASTVSIAFSAICSENRIDVSGA